MKASTLLRIAIIVAILLSVLSLIFGIHTLLESRKYDDIAYTLIGVGVSGLFFTALLKGFRTIVLANEIYIERNSL